MTVLVASSSAAARHAFAPALRATEVSEESLGGAAAAATPRGPLFHDATADITDPADTSSPPHMTPVHALCRSVAAAVGGAMASTVSQKRPAAAAGGADVMGASAPVALTHVDPSTGHCTIVVTTRDRRAAAAAVQAAVAHRGTYFVDFPRRATLQMDSSAVFHVSGSLSTVPYADGGAPLGAWDGGILGQGEVVHIYDTGASSASCHLRDARFPVNYWLVRKTGSSIVQISQSGRGQVVDVVGGEQPYEALASSNHRKIMAYIAYAPHRSDLVYYMNASSTVQATDGIDHEDGHGTGVAGCVAGLREDIYTSHAACFAGDSSICKQTKTTYTAIRKAFTTAADRTYGTAPAARLLVSDLSLNLPSELSRIGTGSYAANGYYLVGFFGGELVDYHLKPGYAAGVRIGSASVGEPAVQSVAYSTYTFSIDRFAHQHDDYLLVMAGGNAGGNGGTQWIMNPAIAKNVLTVGSAQFGASSVTRAAHSSVGPTTDGRIKPDVLAKGIGINGVGNPAPSASATSFLKDVASCQTARRAGTSFAAPTVAGLVALVRQYLREGYYPTGTKVNANGMSAGNMKSSLVKAYIIASARPVLGSTDAATWRPESTHGHGVPVLADVLHFDHASSVAARASAPRHTYHVVAALSTTATYRYHTYVFNLAASPLAAKVVLVWTDLPGSVVGNPRDPELINDIDLTVEHPASGRKWHGNHGTARDSVNNVEVVWLPAEASPPVGRYVVTVRIASLAASETQQQYALVVTGPIVWSADESAPVVQYLEPPPLECESARECGVVVSDSAWLALLGDEVSSCVRVGTARPRCKCWPPGAFVPTDTLCSGTVIGTPTCNGNGLVDTSTGKCACFHDSINGYYEGTQCERCLGVTALGTAKAVQRDVQNKCLVFPVPHCVDATSGGSCKVCYSDATWVASGRIGTFNGAYQLSPVGVATGTCVCKGSLGVGPQAALVPTSTEFAARGLRGVWTGVHCRALLLAAPTAPCAGHGVLSSTTGYCSCYRAASAGWWGSTLDAVPELTAPGTGAGDATGDTAVAVASGTFMTCARCAAGWAGEGCRCRVSAKGVCDGRGTCTRSGCVCSRVSSLTANVMSVTVYDGAPDETSGVSLYTKYTYSVVHGHYGVDDSACIDRSAAASGTCRENCAACAAGWARPTASADTVPCLCEISPSGDVCYGHGVCTPSGCACHDDDERGHWTSSVARAGEAITRCDVCSSGWWGASPVSGQLTNSAHCTCVGSTTGAFTDACNKHGTCQLRGNTSACVCNTDPTAVGMWAGIGCDRCADGYVGPGRAPPRGAFGAEWCACRDWGLNITSHMTECGGHGVCTAGGCSCAVGFADDTGRTPPATCNVCGSDFESPPGSVSPTCVCSKGCGGKGVCGRDGCECRNLDHAPWSSVAQGRWAPRGATYNATAADSFYVGRSCDACAPQWQPAGKCDCHPQSGCVSTASLGEPQNGHVHPLTKGALVISYVPDAFRALPRFGCTDCGCEEAGVCAVASYKDIAGDSAGAASGAVAGPVRAGGDWMGTHFEVSITLQGGNGGGGGGGSSAAPTVTPGARVRSASIASDGLFADLQTDDLDHHSGRSATAAATDVHPCVAAGGLLLSPVSGASGVIRIVTATTTANTNISSCSQSEDGDAVHAYILVPAGDDAPQRWIKLDDLCPGPYALPFDASSPAGANSFPPSIFPSVLGGGTTSDRECVTKAHICCVFPSALTTSTYEANVALFKDVFVSSAWALVRKYFIPILIAVIVVIIVLVLIIIYVVVRVSRAAAARRKMELVAQYIIGRRDDANSSLRRRLMLPPGAAFTEARAARTFAMAAARYRLLAARMASGIVRPMGSGDDASTGSMPLPLAMLALATRGVHTKDTFTEREGTALRAAQTLRASFMQHNKHGMVLKPGLAPGELLRMIHLQSQIEKVTGTGVSNGGPASGMPPTSKSRQDDV